MSLHYKLKNIQYNLKHKYQRAKRGYADSDVWNIDYWFIQTMKPMLVQLRDDGNSYPNEFKNRDQWCFVLNEMLNCLELMDEDGAQKFVGVEPTSYANTKRINEVMNVNKNRFFELFNKYFYDLWD